MKISKWVDMGQEVEIEIGVDDIRAALSECFERATRDELNGEGPNRMQIVYAFDSLAKFLRALTDRHIDCLTHEQRAVIERFLADQSKRFVARGVGKIAHGGSEKSRHVGGPVCTKGGSHARIHRPQGRASLGARSGSDRPFRNLP